MRFALALMLLTACGDSTIPATPDASAPDAFVAPCTEADVEATLRTVPGVTSVIRVACEGGVRAGGTCYMIDFAQPLEHRQPDGLGFTQKLQLVHRSCEAPTVVADWGYASFGFFDDELTALYDANALWIEHRYQGMSVPESFNWKWEAITIENGAGDMHRIIESFRRYYRGRWVSTGASKGGITALYHRYFFPNDVDGTVPYVAPASRQRIDPSYQTYLDTTLPNPCAQRLRTVQIEAVTTRRDAMLQKILAEVSQSYEDYVLEAMVASLDWGFWQAAGTESCGIVPGSGATDDEVWQFLKNLSGFGGAQPAMDELKSGGALEYEWLTEQGFALQIGRHITPLLQLPEANPTMEQRFRFQFGGVRLPDYDATVTLAVRDWTREQAENVVLIYGELDPWSGGAIGAPTQPTSARYFVAGANHGASIMGLRDGEQQAALAHVSRMFGKEPSSARRTIAKQAAEHRSELLDATMRRINRVTLTREL